MADKQRDILEFVEQSNFEQLIPTLQSKYNKLGVKRLCQISELRVSEFSPNRKPSLTYRYHTLPGHPF
jgi:hypothetical protein